MVEHVAVNDVVAGSSPALPATDFRSLGETVVHDERRFHFALEEFRRGDNEQMMFIHLTVRKKTPSTFKEILRRWKIFRECVTCPLYALGGVEDTALWEHFVSLLGFKPLMNVICENGQERRLFVHSINKNKNDERTVVNEPSLKLEFQSERHEPNKPLGRASPVSDAGVPERGK